MRTKLLLITLLISTLTYAQWQGAGNNNGLIGDFLDYPSISISSTNDVYLAYQGNDQKLDVLKLVNNAWISIGADLTTFETRNIQIVIDHNDIPYILFAEKIDGTTDFEIKLIKYDAGTTSWSSAGNVIFTGGTSPSKLVFDSNNIPYVAFSVSNGANSQVSVKKLNGMNWDLVGTDGFSGDSAYLGFDIDSNNTPFVCYSSFINANAGKASVMKFDGTNWVFVGNEGFSPGLSKYHNLSIDANDIVHVGFESSGTNNGSSTVMKLNGTSWEVVGTEGMNNFSRYNNFLIAAADKKYVAFDEFSNNGLIVKTFDGLDWVQVGNNVTTVSAQSIDIAKAPNGNLFVTYLRDFDKKIYVSVFDTTTLSIDEAVTIQQQIDVYPNPTVTSFTISTNNTTIQKVEIFNILGKKVKEKECNNQNKIEIETFGLSKGVYLLKVYSDGEIASKKLIIK